LSESLPIESLRSYLQTVLPEYMIPSALVQLEKLPLTANAKVDRRALPSPDINVYSTAIYEEPQGEIEETMAQLWRGILNVQRIGREDNFFELGGHSLLATQVMVKVRASMSVDLPMRAVFEAPTLREMSARIEQLRNDRLLEMIGSGTDDMQALLKSVAAMPAAEVQALVRELAGGRS